jgi:hypothetical protein
MPLRSTRDTLESVRLVLRTLEMNRDTAWDTRSFIELRRILHTRIAYLKAADARERQASGRASERWAA